MNAFMTSLRDGAPFFAEARVRRADGQWRHIASCGAPRIGEDGRVLGCVGSSPDVTDMREAAARVSEAMRLKDEFLASVAHELRQPISAAVAAVGVMEACRETAVQDRARAVPNRQLQQMSRMVEDQLDASRIVRGDVPLRRSTVELREILGNALDTAASLLQERGHQVETDFPDASTPVDGDPWCLQQVFVNVLTMPRSTRLVLAGFAWSRSRRRRTSRCAGLGRRDPRRGPPTHLWTSSSASARRTAADSASGWPSRETPGNCTAARSTP